MSRMSVQTALLFDKARKYRNISGNLHLLRFKGAGHYELLFEIEDGWLSSIKKLKEHEKTTLYLEVLIAETDNTVRNSTIARLLRAFLADGDDKATDISVEDVAYKILKDHIEPPVSDPRRWTLRVYLAQGQIVEE